METLRREYGTHIAMVNDTDFYEFPTLTQLCKATEQQLRESGFGYRAKFIVATAKMLRDELPDDFLDRLKNRRVEGDGGRDGDGDHDSDRDGEGDGDGDGDVDGTTEVRQALMKLTGVGRKVADCVALFSLEHLSIVPVDTHVFNIAKRDYAKYLPRGLARDKANLSAKLYETIGELFINVHGPYAGWAHSVLFTAELPQFKGPGDGDGGGDGKAKNEKKNNRKRKKSSKVSEERLAGDTRRRRDENKASLPLRRSSRHSKK